MTSGRSYLGSRLVVPGDSSRYPERVDLRERTDLRDARCPYCHDLLGADAERVDCGGCGTRHHAECLAEVGRCTVLGCTWSPDGAAPAHALRPAEAVRQALAERIRRRAVGFVAARAEAEVAGERVVLPSGTPWSFEEEERRFAEHEEEREAKRKVRQQAAQIAFLFLVVVGLLFLLGQLAR
jgi:hypothetical protein